MTRVNTGIKATDFQEGKLIRTEIDGKSIVVGMANGKLYAMDSVCSHEGGPLEDGSLENYNLTCPWHQGIFDIRNAKASPETSWVTDLKSFSVVVDDKSGEISIETAPSGGTGVQNDNRSVAGQKTTVAEEIVSSKPLKLQLKLLEKTPKKGTDVMSFKFSREDEGTQYNNKRSLDYIAGQFAFFDIGGVYNDPKGPIRHFTIASSPTENFILISTRIRDSPYKKQLASLEPGIKVKVRGPEGNFVLHKDYSKSAVFLSGGIGVTPFRSMLKYATDQSLPIKIVMFDSNRNVENTLFKEEFDDCMKHNINVKIVYTVTEEIGHSDNAAGEWQGERGYINKAMLTKYLTRDELDNSIFYICGPPGMLNAMQKMLEVDLGIPKQRIKIEEFTGY
jgi:ferredoxin-NADP reductase/nitrite reductase/ring-hydroxylating ferredoxin subunit